MTLEHRVTQLERQGRFFKVALVVLLLGLCLCLLFIAYSHGGIYDEGGAVKCPLDERDVRDALFQLDKGCTAAERYLYRSGIDLEYFGVQSMREDLQGSGE